MALSVELEEARIAAEKVVSRYEQLTAVSELLNRLYHHHKSQAKGARQCSPEYHAHLEESIRKVLFDWKIK
jgi:hypothetical protein